jgi:hypothetical protein
MIAALATGAASADWIGRSRWFASDLVALPLCVALFAAAANYRRHPSSEPRFVATALLWILVTGYLLATTANTVPRPPRGLFGLVTGFPIGLATCAAAIGLPVLVVSLALKPLGRDAAGRASRLVPAVLVGLVSVVTFTLGLFTVIATITLSPPAYRMPLIVLVILLNPPLLWPLWTSLYLRAISRWGVAPLPLALRNGLTQLESS